MINLGRVEKYLRRKASKEILHFTLIDPDKTLPKEAAEIARKAYEAGTDAIFVGGSIGVSEQDVDSIVKAVKKAVKIPVIAAGGIATGAGLLAAIALGAEAVQMGTRFVVSEESSAHHNFKQAILNSHEGHTMVALKKVIPVRLLKNPFYDAVKELEDEGASKEELEKFLGLSRAKKGMFEGDIINGELEIGQIAGMIDEIKPVKEIIIEIMNEFIKIRNRIC